MKLFDIINNIKEASGEAGISPSNDCILESAVKIMISKNISQDKKDNIQNFSKNKFHTPEKEVSSGASDSSFVPELPTNKQIKLLQSLGVKELPKTKREAWATIKAIKDGDKDESYNRKTR